jgi:hypothetical protein
LAERDYQPDHDQPGRSSRKLALVILCLFTAALPPVTVLLLPATARAVIAVSLAVAPVSLAVAWRLSDDRNRD